MSQEIVPVDPADVFLDMDPILPGDSPTSQFTRSLTFQEHYVWEHFDSERLPATLASGIQRFLRIANLLESEEPRVAYLCRFYTFEETHRIDSSGTERGVRQFKDSLLRKLEKKVQIQKDSESSDGGPSFGVSSSLNEDKYLETQDKLNKIEKMIEEMNMKFKDVDLWTSMMQNMFPGQVPPSMRANQTETNNNDKLSL